MKTTIALIFSLASVSLSLAQAAPAQNEYFVTHSQEARLLSERLQANARTNPKRFDGSTDVAQLPAWLIGSCRTTDVDFHLLAYWAHGVAYIGVFRRNEQLTDLWKFECDARQFYTEGSKLMFVARPKMHQDNAETFAKVPREIIFDFSVVPKVRRFNFHGVSYLLSD